MSSIAAETGVFAQELYELLRVLDRTPGEEAFASLRARIERLRERCRLLVSEEVRDEAVAAIKRALEAILAALEELRERLSRGWSTAAFSSFRSAAAPHYEALSARLRALRVPAPTLRPQNLTRSAYHIANALLAAGLIEFLPSWNAVRVVAGLFLAFAVTMEIGRRLSPAVSRFAMKLFRSVAHPSEEFRVNSATWYAIALFSLALFSGPVPCLLAVLALGIGDPCAAFVGRRWGRHRIHAGRSIEGSAAFVVTAFLLSFAALAFFHPAFSLGLRLALAGATGVIGAITELYSGRVDDNFSIPIVVAVAAHVVLAIAAA